MKIIISPARTMQIDPDSLPVQTMPCFLKQTKVILEWLRQQSYEDLCKLWGNCSPKLARANYQWLQAMDLQQDLTPALLAFTGLQYKYMAPAVFSDQEFAYVGTHLRILSGFYGLLRPFDGIVPYRLGLGDRAQIAGTRNLYDFWGNRLYSALYQDDDLVLNLASKEYSRAIESYLKPGERLVTCIFGELTTDGRVKQKATLAKMARGNMVRYLAANDIRTLAGVTAFKIGYHFDPLRSSADRLVFIKD